jgi:hypothetical protein
VPAPPAYAAGVPAAVPDADDLAGLLAQGERAAFHGRPGDALAPLGGAIAAATGQGREPERRVAVWLRAVALGAVGRYADALADLGPLVAEPGAGAPEQLVAALACETFASVHRQIGSHADARVLDERGLVLAEPLGVAATEARLDCLVGLAADAVGLDEVEEAERRLAAATSAVGQGGTAVGWRPRCRVDWVRAEIALLRRDPEAAILAAGAALDTARHASAPRHVAKSLLFLGVAQATAGRAEAVTTLRRAAATAGDLGTVPLSWPAQAVLGALVGPGAEGDAALAAARTEVRALADALPLPVRERWLARPDLVALLAS